MPRTISFITGGSNDNSLETSLERTSNKSVSVSSILSILSFLISLTTIGAGYTAYKWVTSPNFEKMMMEKVMGKVSGLMPKALDKAMPSSTGISIPKF